MSNKIKDILQDGLDALGSQMPDDDVENTLFKAWVTMKRLENELVRNKKKPIEMINQEYHSKA